MRGQRGPTGHRTVVNESVAPYKIDPHLMWANWALSDGRRMGFHDPLDTSVVRWITSCGARVHQAGSIGVVRAETVAGHRELPGETASRQL